jgi:outer membrane protein assembly factor BamB
MIASFWLAAALTLAAPALASTPSDTLWHYAAPRTIQFTHVDAAGNLLVAMDTVVVALDADSGKPLWTHRRSGPPQVFRNVLDTYLLTGSGHTLTALDPVTGNTVWHRDDLPELAGLSFDTRREPTTALLQAKDGFTVLDLRTGVTRWDAKSLPAGTVVREYFPLPMCNLMLLLARTPLSDVSLLGVTLDSGRVAWRHDALFKKPPKFLASKGVESLVDFPWPLVLADTTLLLYFSPDGPIRLDPRTGVVNWRADASAGMPAGQWEGSYVVPDELDSLVIVASGKQVVALDRATGALRWRCAKAFREPPTWLVSRSQGILVGSFGGAKSFLTALDPATGKRSWPTDLEPKTGATALISTDAIYLSNDDVLSRIQISGGKVDEMATIRFQGGEHAARIDTVEGGGLVLVARQNIMRVNRDGSVVYQRYYKAPTASLLAKLASTALIVGLDVVSYAATPAGGMAPMLLGNPLLSARYGRTRAAANHVYFFTAAPDSTGRAGYSLVMLDRRDGRELGRLWFDERSPDYRLDAVSGTVYEMHGLDITARRLREP